MAALIAGTALPRFVVIRSHYTTDKGYVQYKKNEGVLGTGSAVLGEDESVFSPLVKIETERATSAQFADSKYVHLRFTHSNKYWAMGTTSSRLVVAESNMPEEDTSKPSCTLFEISWVNGQGDGVLYLIHLQSGGRVRIDDRSKAVYVDEKPATGDGYLSYVEWETVVKLPEHVAFKGDNGKYLINFNMGGMPTFSFSSDDPNNEKSGYQVQLMPDGHVRIRSISNPSYLWYIMNVLYPGLIVTTIKDDYSNSALFWPVKIDENTIALRNKENNNFCRSLTLSAITTNMLSAVAPTIVKEAMIQVQELLMGRRIYNVRYRMEDARIFGETPYLAGTTTLTNDADVQASIAVAITYTDEKSYSFGRSLSIAAGVTNTIETSLLEIVKASIQFSLSITKTFDWNDTTTITTSITATGSVPVPARTIATVSYVGTKGTCNVPFSYTKQDTSSTDGRINETEEIDGIYTGVNYYNFNFVVEKTVPI